MGISLIGPVVKMPNSPCSVLGFNPGVRKSLRSQGMAKNK